MVLIMLTLFCLASFDGPFLFSFERLFMCVGTRRMYVCPFNTTRRTSLSSSTRGTSVTCCDCSQRAGEKRRMNEIPVRRFRQASRRPPFSRLAPSPPTELVHPECCLGLLCCWPLDCFERIYVIECYHARCVPCFTVLNCSLIFIIKGR